MTCHSLLYIDRFAVHRKRPFFQLTDYNLQARLFVIECNDQKVRMLDFMGFDTDNFLKDRTYPFACASGKASGNRHLHDSFGRAGRVRQGYEKNKR
ncbi:MAG: hypothetical protein CVU51_04710 [Deltaproteobacteria bacterium HGW-Deltaproteobacteria-1]|jgi:hypothetical protein|nr:MAG: hypothetical protein CVU51_04710 [Deltaproteobacteria bacterium HGW-Deltaproteobacteria-1]